jgi:hypothetical protein
MTTDPYAELPAGRGMLVRELLRRAGGFTGTELRRRTPPGPGDPLHAVTASRTAGGPGARLGA